MGRAMVAQCHQHNDCLRFVMVNFTKHHLSHGYVQDVVAPVSLGSGASVASGRREHLSASLNLVALTCIAFVVSVRSQTFCQMLSGVVV